MVKFSKISKLYLTDTSKFRSGISKTFCLHETFYVTAFMRQIFLIILIAQEIFVIVSSSKFSVPVRLWTAEIRVRLRSRSPKYRANEHIPTKSLRDQWFIRHD